MSAVILVAPAAFKGTFGPRQVADAMAAGIRRALPEATLLQCPIADGGDGLLDAVLPPDSWRERLAVTGPLGAPVAAELGWIDSETAIFESATAAGLALLSRDQLDPLRATTRGVGAYTLLVSPDAFDLTQPIKVTSNGRVVFDAKVQPSVATLMKWAARDNDRTMLYAAEIAIKLPR